MFGHVVMMTIETLEHKKEAYGEEEKIDFFFLVPPISHHHFLREGESGD